MENWQADFPMAYLLMAVILGGKYSVTFSSQVTFSALVDFLSSHCLHLGVLLNVVTPREVLWSFPPGRLEHGTHHILH